VARLLTLGREPASRRVWPDYRNLGLTSRHVPELIRMATDSALLAAEERAATSWAPVHAWRALGQLEAAPAAAPLLALLERSLDDSAVVDEVPSVLGMIGPPSLPGATLLLFDEERDERLRVTAARVLTEVAHEYPERRDEAAAVLVQQLEDWPHQSPVLNAFLIAFLAELGEVAAAPLMEAAYAGGAVDLSVHGDWEDVQVDLGLLEERVTPPTPGSYFDPDADHAPQPARRAAANAAASAKARRKAEKQSRKRNRKRK
jgi:hypothetical protein